MYSLVCCSNLHLNLFLNLSFFRRTGRAGNKGSAYTFITPEQERYAGEIIRALELSDSPVAPDLAKLWNDYKERAKAVSVHML